MDILILIIIAVLVLFLIKTLWNKSKWKLPSKSFPSKWRVVLQKKVTFYNALSADEKTQFEFKVQEFLLNCRITGIEVDVDIQDKLLVAASAVIPIFRFPKWRYINFSEVLLYPSSFNEKFETSGPDKRIMGMVGTGYMDGKMILSKPALHHGFSNESDKKNTAIHEFVHIIDKADGSIDGIPEVLMEKQYAIPWLDLIQQKIDDIYVKKSDINPYGATNRTEFFAVTSEYFFERPKLLAKKHPVLYKAMEEIFNHDMTSRNLKNNKPEISRNSPCPCNSGEKFKKCCGRVHYK